MLFVQKKHFNIIFIIFFSAGLSCIRINHVDHGNLECNFVILNKRRSFFYKDMGNFSLQIRQPADFDSFSQLNDGKGVKFRITESNSEFICLHVNAFLNKETSIIEFNLLKTIVDGTVIKFLSNLEYMETPLVWQTNSYLKTHTVQELQEQLCGCQAIKFDGQDCQGFIFVRDAKVQIECLVYCFSKVSDAFIEFSVFSNSDSPDTQKLINETIYILECMFFHPVTCQNHHE